MTEAGETPRDNKAEFIDHGVEYAQYMSSHIVDDCLRLGLDPKFADFFEQHLKELHIVEIPITYQDIEKDNAETLSLPAADEISTPRLAYQDISCVDNGKTEIAADETQPVHAILLTLKDIGLRRLTLKKVLEDLAIKLPQNGGEALLQQAAIDWIFYEQACAALGNACYMAQNLPYYVTDFDGQNPYVHADRSISAAFLRGKRIVTSPDLKFDSVAEDALNLQRGFGLMMLHTSLLSRGVVKKNQQANWVIARLRQAYPKAHRSEDIKARLSAIKPMEISRPSMAELAMSTFDPELEPEFEAEEQEKNNT